MKTILLAFAALVLTANGGPFLINPFVFSGSTLKTGLRHWYDLSIGGVEDLTDQHGTGADLVDIGTGGVATSDYLTIDGTNRFESTTAFMTDIDEAAGDWTFAAGVTVGTVVNGGYIFNAVSGPTLYLRMLTGSWSASMFGITELSDTTNPTTTTYVVSGRFTTSSDTVNKAVSITGGDIEEDETAGTPSDPTARIIFGTGLGATTIQVHWFAVWERALTDDELNNALLKSVTTAYSDL